MKNQTLILKQALPVKSLTIFHGNRGGFFILGDEMKKLTQKRLKELLSYDPETGVFVWVVQKSNNIKVGQIAGCVNKVTGYRDIMINGRTYKSSRLVWLYIKGYFPEHQMDHINRIKNDDRWENLRHVSSQCNTRNCNVSKNNKSGITGVSWRETHKKWYARIMISGKAVHLGSFKSKLDATKARWNAEVKHSFPNCNTTSSAYLYLKKGGKA